MNMLICQWDCMRSVKKYAKISLNGEGYEVCFFLQKKMYDPLKKVKITLWLILRVVMKINGWFWEIRREHGASVLKNKSLGLSLFYLKHFTKINMPSFKQNR